MVNLWVVKSKTKTMKHGIILGIISLKMMNNVYVYARLVIKKNLGYKDEG